MPNEDLSTPVPPDHMLHLVSGHADRENWASSRLPAVRDVILPRLSECGFDLRQTTDILDFGCGCGRLLAGWEPFMGKRRLYGVDINPSLIGFCQAELRHATCSTCQYYPPLDFPDRSFDLIYAASVFTHLSLPAAMQWAGEIARIARPGCAWMVSYHGPAYTAELARLSKSGVQRLEERGIYMHTFEAAAGGFQGSNDYATFMTSGFVVSLFKGFDLVRIYPSASYGPTHFAAHQDVAIFRRAED